MNATSPPVVLITGGSRGIGLAIARAFLEQGDRVALCGLHQDTLDAAQRLLALAGNRPRAKTGTCVTM